MQLSAPLVDYVPLSLDVSIPCTALRDMTGGTVLSTVPAQAPRAGSKGLVARIEDRPGAGRTLSVVLRDKLLLSAPIADIAGNAPAKEGSVADDRNGTQPPPTDANRPPVPAGAQSPDSPPPTAHRPPAAPHPTAHRPAAAPHHTALPLTEARLRASGPPRPTVTSHRRARPPRAHRVPASRCPLRGHPVAASRQDRALPAALPLRERFRRMGRAAHHHRLRSHRPVRMAGPTGREQPFPRVHRMFDAVR